SESLERKHAQKTRRGCSFRHGRSADRHRGGLHQGLSRAASMFGIEMALCHSMVGVPTAECEAMIEAHFGPAFRGDHFQLCFRQQAEHLMSAAVPVKAGARELLAWLTDRGLPLAIATSSRPATVERHLGRAGLLGHFKAVATRHDVERPKPFPDVYLEAA